MFEPFEVLFYFPVIDLSKIEFVSFTRIKVMRFRRTHERDRQETAGQKSKNRKTFRFLEVGKRCNPIKE